MSHWMEFNKHTVQTMTSQRKATKLVETNSYHQPRAQTTLNVFRDSSRRRWIRSLEKCRQASKPLKLFKSDPILVLCSNRLQSLTLRSRWPSQTTILIISGRQMAMFEGHASPNYPFFTLFIFCLTFSIESFSKTFRLLNSSQYEYEYMNKYCFSISKNIWTFKLRNLNIILYRKMNFS